MVEHRIECLAVSSHSLLYPIVFQVNEIPCISQEQGVDITDCPPAPENARSCAYVINQYCFLEETWLEAKQ